MKTKVSIIIASKDFRDEEYFITKEILESKEIIVKTFSDKKEAIGKFGGEAKVDNLIENLKVNDFDAIVFVGGSGAIELLDNDVSYNICKSSIEEGKILAAICISPVILAKSGVLKNKKATVWSSNLDKSAIKILKENGALYEKGHVIIDQNIITGENAESVEEFSNALIKSLTKS